MEHVKLVQELIKFGLDRKTITKWTDEKLEDKYNKIISKE